MKPTEAGSVAIELVLGRVTIREDRAMCAWRSGSVVGVHLNLGLIVYIAVIVLPRT